MYCRLGCAALVEVCNCCAALHCAVLNCTLYQYCTALLCVVLLCRFLFCSALQDDLEDAPLDAAQYAPQVVAEYSSAAAAQGRSVTLTIDANNPKLMDILRAAKEAVADLDLEYDAEEMQKELDEYNKMNAAYKAMSQGGAQSSSYGMRVSFPWGGELAAYSCCPGTAGSCWHPAWDVHCSALPKYAAACGENCFTTSTHCCGVTPSCVA
jgi:hypothetical protein